MFVSSKIFALPSGNNCKQVSSHRGVQEKPQISAIIASEVSLACILHKMMEDSVCHVFSSLHRKETSDNSSPVPSKIGLKQPVHVSQDVATSLALLPQLDEIYSYHNFPPIYSRY